MFASPNFGMFYSGSRRSTADGRLTAIEPEDVHGLGIRGAREEAPAWREGKTAPKKWAISPSHFHKHLFNCSAHSELQT